MTGIYYILNVLPIWATAGILYIMTLGVILVLRDVKEGMPYNIAYSAFLGEAGLMIGILIAQTELKQPGVRIPWVLQSHWAHALIIGASFSFCIVGSIRTWKLRSGQLGDRYHDLVIAPLIGYSGFTLLPVIVLNGTTPQWIAIGSILAAQVCFFVKDIHDRRLNQRVWLKSNFCVIFTDEKK